MARKKAADADATVTPTDETAAPAAEADPTPAEAEAMFADRPELSGIRTTAGWLTREGVLTPVLSAE